mmetsp:Transcript_14954/g.56790  ORF Transcript_14954/g.56790 Transcript_14954/m.56790 type:complete len:272 (+) Transcript_14954:1347-2162(+)
MPRERDLGWPKPTEGLDARPGGGRGRRRRCPARPSRGAVLHRPHGSVLQRTGSEGTEGVRVAERCQRDPAAPGHVRHAPERVGARESRLRAPPASPGRAQRVRAPSHDRHAGGAIWLQVQLHRAARVHPTKHEPAVESGSDGERRDRVQERRSAIVVERADQWGSCPGDAADVGCLRGACEWRGSGQAQAEGRVQIHEEVLGHADHDWHPRPGHLCISVGHCDPGPGLVPEPLQQEGCGFRATGPRRLGTARRCAGGRPEQPRLGALAKED